MKGTMNLGEAMASSMTIMFCMFTAIALLNHRPAWIVHMTLGLAILWYVLSLLFWLRKP